MAGGGHSDVWTDERIGELKRLWGEELCATAIAKALGNGLTKGAVVGKLHRLGLTRPRIGQAKAAKPKTEPKTRAKPASMPLPKPQPPVKLGHLKPPAKRYQVPFGKATSEQCHYPLWDWQAKTGLVCGAPVALRGPFCPYHSMLCWRTATELRRGGADCQSLAELAQAMLPKAIGPRTTVRKVTVPPVGQRR